MSSPAQALITINEFNILNTMIRAVEVDCYRIWFSGFHRGDEIIYYSKEVKGQRNFFDHFCKNVFRVISV